MILSHVGRFSIFLGSIIKALPKIHKRRYEIVSQINKIGIQSILLVVVTSAFTGFVTAVQASYQTKGYIPNSLIGVLVGKSTMIELAPVLTGLVLSGKVGASLTAEIGSMCVTEQLDALRSLAIDKEDFVYLPRIVAGTLSFPILTIFANFVAIIAAFCISYFIYDLSFYTFFNGMKNFFLPSDLWGGLIKSTFFGFFVTLIACYFGDQTKGGAEGVGRATTITVVASSIVILVLDFLIAGAMFGA